jgi:type I restriction-modification system DNA methylase subunit
MDKRALKEFLQKRYESPEAFLENVIFPVFGEENYDSSGNYHWLTKHPEDQIAAANAGIKDILALGSIYVEGSQLDIFDITVASKRHLANNRVSIQSLIRRIISTYSGAFMIFHYQTSDRWDWRFSFCHKGASQLDSSDAKRYTFLLGPGQSCRTAAENFCKLGEKIANNGEFEMSDIIKAFDVEALSKEFFDKYKSQYEKFVSYMADETNGMRAAFIDTGFDRDGLSDEEIRSREEKPLRDYVKKLLGRIVFLHFIQKKGWLGVEPGKEWNEGDMDFMMNLYDRADEAQQANFLDAVLEPLFEKGLNTDRSDNDDLFDTGVKALPNNGIVKIPYLNGGLFEREESDEPDTVFPAEYFKSLLTFFAQYNFTIDENDPNDAQVGIDPEMLGRIFENLLEDNKDKGAFYTPKEIVQYMCRESLIAYLQTDKDEAEKQAIRNFVMEYDITSLSESQKSEIDQKLKAVKICDPAIGSGAFPMGLLRELFLCRGVLENFNNAAEIKRHIIQKNIYGVDIEKGAVDIARLRFWLCLIVDEETPHALPNLDFKVMQGNSLLESYKGIDLSQLTAEKKMATNGFQFSLYEDETDVQRRKLRNLLDEYYDCQDHAQKDAIRKKIAGCIQSQLDASGLSRQGRFGEELIDLSQINIAGNNQFFLWHTWFNDVFEQGGFDIVIGNPPYIQLQNNGGQLAKLYAECGYKTFARTGDIYCLVYERGYQLLKQDGHLCFITSNKWMRAGYGEKTREFFANYTDPQLLIDFAGVKIFESATVDTNILLFSKSENRHNTLCAISNKQDKDSIKNLSVFVQQNGTICGFSGSDSWVILSPIEQSIKRKIEAVGTPLKDWNINIYRGVLTGYNDAFIISTEKRDEILANCADEVERERTAELIRPILRGRDIKRYGYNWANLWLINTHNGIKGKLERIHIENYPAVKAHLDQYWDKISKRADKGDTPYNLRNCAYLDLFFQPHICWKAVGKKLAFALVEGGTFLTAPASFISAGKYNDLILTYLCSNIGTYFIYKNSDTTGAGDIMLNIQSLIKFPVPLIDTDMSSLTDEAKEDLVYSSYGFSKDEIRYIESQI